jgi:hypothetical protein
MAQAVLALSFLPTQQVSAASWTTNSLMATARDNHTATLLLTGKVLTAGESTSSGATNGVELYDPDTRSNTITGSLNVARWGTRPRC